MTSAREVAINIIEQTLKGAEIQDSLNEHLKRHRLKKVDKNLITTICYGYLRFKKRIDFILKKTIKGNIKKLPKNLLIALGCGVYEILFLEKIPEYATVYWYVEYCKKNISTGLSGLVNAVLRHISRIKDEVLSERFYKHKDIKVFLSKFYSFPLWIVELWIEKFGIEKTIVFLKRFISPPKVGIRINPKNKESVSVYSMLKTFSPLAYIEGLGFAFEKTPSVPINEFEQKGILTRQSFEAQRIMMELNPSLWHMPIWDCCCGRGLKTTLLMERDIYKIFASDINLNRLLFLRKEFQRLNLKGIPAFKADATSFSPKKTPETIFIDVPCSGLGVLNRRPDIKWKRNPHEITRLKKIQRLILSNALSVLKKGGKIVYITCTLNPEENEEMIRKFSVKILQEISTEEFIKDPERNEFFYGIILEK